MILLTSWIVLFLSLLFGLGVGNFRDLLARFALRFIFLATDQSSEHHAPSGCLKAADKFNLDCLSDLAMRMLHHDHCAIGQVPNSLMGVVALGGEF